MIIDAHCHIFVEEWLPEAFWQGLAEAGRRALAAQGLEVALDQLWTQLAPLLFDPSGEKQIASMEEAGIDRAILLPLDYGLGLGGQTVPVEEQNRLHAEIVRRFPDKLVAFAGVDPRRPNAVDLFERAISEWGFKGLKLHPTSGYYPNDKVVYPLYEKAQEYGVPVLIHTGPIIGRLRSKYAQPIYLDDVCVDFPELQVIAAHLGFCWRHELMNIAATVSNLAMDFSGWQPRATRRYAEFCRELRETVDEVGIDRVLFGTDGPAYRPLVNDKQWVDLVKGLPENAPEGVKFTAQEVDALLGGTAKKLLRL